MLIQYLLINYYNQKLYLVALLNGAELTWATNEQLFFLLTNIGKD